MNLNRISYKQEAEIYLLKNPYKGQPISISGPSAIGKSTFCRLIAKKMNLPFFDLDDEITKKAGKTSTKEVIQNLGHAYFKEVQHNCLNAIILSNSYRYILAAGGEILRPGYDSTLIEKNRQLLKEHTYNICLLPSDNLDEIVQILYPRLNDGRRDTRTKNAEEFRAYVDGAISQYIDLADVVIFTHNAKIGDIFILIMNRILNNF